VLRGHDCTDAGREIVVALWLGDHEVLETRPGKATLPPHFHSSELGSTLYAMYQGECGYLGHHAYDYAKIPDSEHNGSNQQSST
jgi:hypothetical protein